VIATDDLEADDKRWMLDHLEDMQRGLHQVRIQGE
jgi:hypothetical protein